VRPAPANFIEIVTCVPDGDDGTVPAEATFVPLQAAPEALAGVTRSIARTTTRLRARLTRLRARLTRFEGLHILVFCSRDAELTAARLTAQGIPHGGAKTVQRSVQTSAGPRLEPVHLLEIDSDDSRSDPAAVPEGRLAVAERGAPASCGPSTSSAAGSR
jgi:hypothetical protein